MKNLISTSTLVLVISIMVNAQGRNNGYYRFPAIYQNTIVFTAEGDLYSYSLQTEQSKRLTSNHGVESHARISPDGKWIAFSAQYEGPTEVYRMPLEGGVPTRLTFEGERALVVGWDKGGRIMYSTTKYSTLPARQLALVDPQTGVISRLPLAQAANGCYGPNGELYFERLPFQGSHTKRYKGGSVQQIWKYMDGSEAINLTVDYLGTSKDPMWFNNRLFFASDRDGTMNIWSMDSQGKDLRQHTHSVAWDVKSPDLQNGKIVYQQGADLWLYDITADESTLLSITINSDFDQKRPQWIDHPLASIQNLSFSYDGSKVALQSRGRVFVAPTEPGRRVELTRKYGVRYRNIEYAGETNKLLMLSDESGEVEVWQAPDDGMSPPSQISNGSNRLIMNMSVSPDGEQVVYHDKDLNMYLLNVNSKSKKLIGTADYGYGIMSWSPDSRWIAYEDIVANQNIVIVLYQVSTGNRFTITSARLDSYNPVWGMEKKWLYFLSDRDFKPSVYSPWGSRQPEPYYEHTTKIYGLALQKDTIPAFLGKNELLKNGSLEKLTDSSSGKKGKGKKKKNVTETDSDLVKIDLAGLNQRLYEWPVTGKNIRSLAVNKKYLYWTERNGANVKKTSLHAVKISEKKPKDTKVADDVRAFTLSGNGEKLLIYKKNGVFTGKATGGKIDESKTKLDLSGWKFKIDPEEEWKQMFVDAWRLERDYFYDPSLHGTAWKEILDRHLPLVSRVTDRYELDDLISDMVSELSALHTFVYGGDKRTSDENINMASLGAHLQKVSKGYRIERMYQSDPDYPLETGPMSGPGHKIKEGDVITAINGVLLNNTNPAELLANQQEKQVRLTLTNSLGTSYEEIVKPITSRAERNLRYSDWEYTRRKRVEKQGNGQIGYIHLRAMGGNDYTEFLKAFYPVFNRQGLIIDMRNNRGGNIDSWVLEKLMRKAWFYFQPRAGGTTWNMQYAFRGHMVVLVNERTASDGEAFAEGFRRLKLGKVIGKRTWGGEIWLTSSNRLVDNGIATAAEFGVYSGEGEWLIEGHGVDPDFEVDNLPHATFIGSDAQLDYAIKYLQELIQKDPRLVPEHPKYPDKSFDYKKK